MFDVWCVTASYDKSSREICVIKNYNDALRLAKFIDSTGDSGTISKFTVYEYLEEFVAGQDEGKYDKLLKASEWDSVLARRALAKLTATERKVLGLK